MPHAALKERPMASIRQLIFESSPLLFGVGMILMSVGLQGTLLGVRASIEGFSMMATGIIMTAFYVGFLFGARYVPRMISKVGHIRIFAALGSMASMTILLHATLVSPQAWFFIRLLAGFCFSGIYIVAESWLNARAPNHLRGQLFAVYMIVNLGSMAVGQYLLTLADPAEMTLFILISLLVSLAIIPCAVSAQPAPEFNKAESMTVLEVVHTSNLGAWAVVVSGLCNGFFFGMGALYGREIGLDLVQISTFIAAYIVGGALLQWPIGRLSDRMNRRVLLLLIAAIGSFAAFMAPTPDSNGWSNLLIATVLIGGVAVALYSLGVSMINDRLPTHSMVAASGGLVFLNGLGAAFGPIAASWLMHNQGPDAFFVGIGIAIASTVLLGAIRFMYGRANEPLMRRHYPPIAPRGSDIALSAACEAAADETDSIGSENA